MHKVVMVPLDGSRFAEQAMPLALSMARRARASLRLVRVQPTFPLDSADGEAHRYLDRIARQLETQVVEGIEQHVLMDESGPLEYSPPVSMGVADLLSRYARSEQITFVVMASHGHGGFRRAWLGSVADALIRVLPCPLLLVRPADEAFSTALTADRWARHILIPLDGSETAEAVIPCALDFGRPFEARYTLLRVVTPLSRSVVPYASGGAPPSRLSRAAAVAYLYDVAGRMRESGVVMATQLIDGTSPARTIVEFADSHGVDVIAMGTEGAGRARRLLLGSVTDKVVRSSNSPVLVCNARHAVEANGRTERQSVAAG
ncbi:universal stress protein [soil metagenome]